MSDSQQEIAAHESLNESDLTNLSKQTQRQTKDNKLTSTKRITYTAVFIALALVMKLIGKALTITDSVTITFIYIPWLLAGVVLGPLGGCLVGLTSDILGNLIFVGMAGFNPITLLSNTLYALPIALLYKTRIKSDYTKVILGSVISLFLCTLGIGSFAIYWSRYLTGGGIEIIGYFEWFVANRLFQPIVLAVNVIVLCIMVEPLKNLGIYPTFEENSTVATKKSSILLPLIVIITLALVAILLSVLTGNSTPLSIIMISSVCAIVGVLLVISKCSIARDKLMLNGIILLIAGIVTITGGVIVWVSAVNIYTFVPSFWMYLLPAIPLTLVAMLVRGYKKGAYNTQNISSYSKRLFVFGNALTILSAMFFVAVLTLKILLII